MTYNADDPLLRLDPFPLLRRHSSTERVIRHQKNLQGGVVHIALSLGI
jgi:hypothetical protein